MRRQIAALSLVLAALLASGCASSGPPAIEDALAARGVRPDETVIPFALTDEMRQWVRAAVPMHFPVKQKVQILLARVLDPKALDLEYDSGHSGTAEEVYRTRRANCMGFTHLFVGLAREVGLHVQFLRVNDVETFNRDGDLVVVSGHVTVGYFDDAGKLRVLDFTAQPIRQYRNVVPLSDLAAIALFHSNRGAEQMRAGDDVGGLRWLEQAVRIEPTLVDGWVNLGVALRRNGRDEAAEKAYRHALELDPESSSAYQNLAVLLQLRGRNDSALELLRLANRLQTRNPYTYLVLGDWNLARGRLDDARAFYDRARRVARRNADPLAALGLWELTAGNHDKANEFLRRAKEIDPANDRVERLEARLVPQLQAQG